MTVHISELTASYGNTKVLDRVSFDIKPGTITALIGANGAGKTTLVRCLTGEIQDYKGKILLDGKELRSFSAKSRAKEIACLPQQLPCPHITVQDLVSFGRAPYTALTGKLSPGDREAVNLALERSQTTHLAHSFVDQLSGGQQKKAFFAMTMAQDTPIIILDEPTAHLDAASRFAYLDLLQSMCSQTGKTFLVVMHDLTDVLRYAHQIVVLKDQSVCFVGTAEECLENAIAETVFGIRIQGTRKTGYAALPLV